MKKYLLCMSAALVTAGLFWLVGCSTAAGPARHQLFLGQEPGPSLLMGASRPDSLVVVSYNIAFAQKTPEAAAELLADPRLRQADILLLQEMDLEGVEYVGRALKMGYVYGPAYRHPRYGKLWGNAVLSKWPIIGSKDVVLPHPNPFSSNYRRAIAADIKVAGQMIRAVSVHMSTVVIPLEDRLHQAAVLADSLGQMPYPTIIGGDFNTGSRHEIKKVRQVLRGRRLRQVRLPAEKTAQGGPLDLFDHDLMLDHFFYRGLIAAESGIASTFTSSDHYPIWAVFAFPKEQ